MRRLALALLVLCAACGDNRSPSITVDAPAAWSSAVGELLDETPYPGRLALGDDGWYQIALTDDPAIPLEGYRLERVHANRWVVHAHDLLGAQYGVSAALENLGFRFRHPYDPYVPRAPADEGLADGALHQPQVRVRGFQFHTLHPIEPYFALWEPSADNTADAHRIINWVIANRGNYLQWVLLNDILDPARYAAWKPFTQELIAYAHARGLRVGVGVELFGQSNLQLAYDLYDDRSGTITYQTQIAQRLQPITQDLPWDVVALSYGEFFDSDPQLFIDATNEVRADLRVDAPLAEMHADVHVGATQRVTYMGQDLIYYFLVQFADPSIVPDIHTVMYYDLFEDAGGAYQHQDFSEHRAYLEKRMCARQPVAYFPEDAYWVAFDDSVPVTLPLYVHSRWLDLSMLSQAGCGPLDEQLLFSSGWEWSYWLNDVSAMRASYELPATPGALIADQYRPDLGPKAAALVDRLATVQHDALIGQRLAPYLASRDAVIDAGRTIGIISQPDRITFDDLVAHSDVASFQASVLDPLAALASSFDDIQHDLDQLSLPDSRWARELKDGVAIDRLRAHFIHEAYAAVVAKLSGADPQPAYKRASQLLDQATTVITARHRDLHDPHGRRLLDEGTNRTEYQYGYLHQGDKVCYWHRELDQVAVILGVSTETPPNCFY